MGTVKMEDSCIMSMRADSTFCQLCTLLDVQTINSFRLQKALRLDMDPAGVCPQTLALGSRFAVAMPYTSDTFQILLLTLNFATTKRFKYVLFVRFAISVFTVRLHVMQRTVLLSEFCLSVRPPDARIVTKLNNALRIF